MTQIKSDKLVPMINTYSMKELSIQNKLERLFASILVNPGDIAMIATHKYIDDIFNVKEKRLSVFNIDVIKIVILLDIFYCKEKFCLYARDTFWRTKFSKQIKFIQKYAIPMMESIIYHKNTNSDIYKRIIKCTNVPYIFEPNIYVEIESMFIVLCFMIYPKLESKLVETGNMMIDSKLLINESLYTLEKMNLMISNDAMVQEVKKQNSLIHELYSQIRTIENEHVVKLLKSIAPQISIRLKSKKTGRPSIVNKELIFKFVDFRDNHDNLNITAVLTRVSERNGVEKSTIRKWLSSNIRYIPNPQQYQKMKLSTILKNISKEEVAQFFENKKREEISIKG